MGDDTKPRGRDRRLTKRPPDGSVQARAVTQGAEMIVVATAEVDPVEPESAQALSAVPRGEFEDLQTNPVALDLHTQQELEKYRAKRTAVETRANLVLTNRVSSNVEVLTATVDKMAMALASIATANNTESIDRKRWNREQIGNFLAIFTSGGLFVALVNAVIHYFLGSP